MNENIKNKITDSKQKLYHIGISREDIDFAEIAILPGDPERVASLAKMLDSKAQSVAVNREYTSYLAEIKDQKILVISTGMGCPSVAIGVEELAMLGVKKFIRVGTTGTIQEKVTLGDLIINNAAVRLEGTSSHYAPLEFPATADLELTYQLAQSAKKFAIRHFVGIGISSDTFWAGQERYDGFSGYVIPRLQGSLAQWQKLGVLNYEMEASSLFTICSVFGLRAACICCAIAKRTDSEQVDKTKYQQGMENIMKIIGDIL
jgi:uridine phosphorylase